MTEEDTHHMFQTPEGVTIHEHVNDSMSISDIRRDVFAALAMHAILGEPGGPDMAFDFISRTAYKVADAMELARKTTP